MKATYLVQVSEKITPADAPRLIDKLFIQAKKRGESSIFFGEDLYIRTSYEDGEYYSYISLHIVALTNRYSKKILVKELTDFLSSPFPKD